MRHINLAADWLPPPSPPRFPDLTAVKSFREIAKGFWWHLDYSRVSEESPVGRWFASDVDRCPEITWPWQDKFEPTKSDWEYIGFIVIEIIDKSEGINLRDKQIRSAMNEILFDAQAELFGSKQSPGRS